MKIKSIKREYRYVRINDDSDEIGIFILGVPYTIKNKLKKDIERIHKFELDKNDELYEKHRSIFNLTYGFKYENLLAYGATSKVKQDYIKELVSMCTFKTYDSSNIGDNLKLVEKTSWRCCTKRGNVKDYHNDPKTAGLVIHSDFGSAWVCIKEALKYPESMIIFKT